MFLNFPDGFGGDYELAIDDAERVYLLQCSPLKMIRDIGDVDQASSCIQGIETPRGCVDGKFERIIYSGNSICPDEGGAWKESLRKLFLLNQQYPNSLLLVRSLLEPWVPEVAYNALGIIEFYEMSAETKRTPRGREAIDHYTSLLRTEKIGFVHAELKPNVKEHIITTSEDKVRILDVKGRLAVNELRGQAGLYLSEQT